MMLFDRSLSLAPSTEPSGLPEFDVHVDWEAELEVGTLRHSVELFDTSASPEQGRMFSQRVLCYLFIDHMPPEGLPESLETIVDLYKFYHEREIRPLRLPVVEKIQARLGSEQVQEPFQVETE